MGNYLGLLLGLALVSPLQAQTMTLSDAIERAIEKDPWLTASTHKQASMEAMSQGATALPDPRFSVGMMNLPTDTFNYNQEGMTQLQFGVSQMIPRGDSLELQSQKYQQLGELKPLERQQRRAQVTLTVSQLWLDALKATLSIQLIEDNRILFEQLSDVVRSSYSSTFGRTRQQDLVRAVLELDQLDERLVQLQQQNVVARQKLKEWVQPKLGDKIVLDHTMPILVDRPNLAPDHLQQQLMKHPEIKRIDQSIEIAKTDVGLAQQKYEPEWMVNASYGVRGSDPMGNDRADLFSFAVSVDVPIFSRKRQDAQVSAETYAMESIRTERLLALRTLMARYQTLSAEIDRLDERLYLYQNRLLPGLNQSAEAAISAYTADDGSFAEVVQARISELNAKLAQLNIRLERGKKIAELNYLLRPGFEGGES